MSTTTSAIMQQNDLPKNRAGSNRPKWSLKLR